MEIGGDLRVSLMNSQNDCMFTYTHTLWVMLRARDNTHLLGIKNMTISYASKESSIFTRERATQLGGDVEGVDTGNKNRNLTLITR